MKLFLNKENLFRFIWVIFGSFLISIGINTFLVPHKLLSGGISGISIIFQYITNINSGIFVLALNIPIFIMGYKYIDKNFTIVSLIGMSSLSLFLILTKNLSSLNLINDLLASTILGGLINGLGSGIIFKNKGSTGGTDIISVILKRKYEITISSLIFYMNLIVVLIGGLINNLELAVYTLIGMFISSTVINKIIIGFDNKKLLLIITDKEKEVSNFLMKEIKRGVTLLHGKGAYTGKDKNIIYCVVSAKQFALVKRIINVIDNKAFIAVLDVSEIQGKGFKAPLL